MTHERRKTPRRAVDVPARLRLAGDVVDVRLHDICRDAALVEGNTPLDVGTRVELAVTLPGLATPIELAGHVIRSDVGDMHAHAFAVLFDDVSPGDATRIDFYVALYDERGSPAPPADPLP